MTEVKTQNSTPAEFSAETLAYIEARSKSVAQASDKLRAAHQRIEAWLGDVITESGVLPDGSTLDAPCERAERWSLAGVRDGRMYLLTDYDEIRDRETVYGAHWVTRSVLVAGTRKLPAHLTAYAEKLRESEKEFEEVAAVAEAMAKLLPEERE